MKIDSLYQIQRKDLPKLQKLLTACFADDPLYSKLIPNETLRDRLLPVLFKCDLLEYFSDCQLYADSEEINGFILVSDKTDFVKNMHYHFEEFISTIKTDLVLIKEDSSLKTLAHFITGKDYLNSKWTEALPHNRLHIIYLAVNPAKQHHGISVHLLNEVINYADSKDFLLSLETHNAANLELYHHHGFVTYEIIQKHFDLTQYCLIKYPTK